MLIIILKNFSLFNYIYNILNLKVKYIKNFLLPSFKILILKKKKIILNFKKIFFFKLKKKKNINNYIKFYLFKIFIIKKNYFYNFNFFFKKNKIIFENYIIKKIFLDLETYVFTLFYLNYYFKIIFFLI